MSSIAWLILIFFVLVLLSLLVYVLVIRAFYWGDRKGPPAKKALDQTCERLRFIERYLDLDNIAGDRKIGSF